MSVIGVVVYATAGARAEAEPGERPEPTYLIDTWETDQGLPENSATAMVQTRDGYLWFGTFAGLARFDGVAFTVLTPANTPGMPGTGVVNIHLDKSDRLWVSTIQGLAVRSGENWRKFDATDGWTGDFVRTFSERGNGDLLLTTFDGKILEYSGGRFVALPLPTGTSQGGWFGVVDQQNRWWVVQGGFVGFWDGSKWARRIELSEVTPQSVGCVRARDGGVWVLLERELIKFDGEAEVKRLKLAERPGGVWSLFEDSRGNVWIASFDSGVCRVAPDGSMERWDSSHGISHNSTRFVFEDREGNLWVGSSGGGLMRFKERRARHYGVENGVTERVVKSVWPDAGGVWIGTYGEGLFRLKNGEAVGVPLATPIGGKVYTQSVLSDRQGHAWVGTYGGGLYVMDESGTRAFPPEESGGGNVIALFEDSRGRIWVSGGQSVSVFDAGKFDVFGTERRSAQFGVCCFAEDREGTIWVSNQLSVCRLVERKFVEVLDPSGKPISDVGCIRFELDGSVWMGTRSAGLLRLRSGRLDHVDTEKGLLATHVSGILEDDAGYWWMASNSGIMRAERRALEAVANGDRNVVECQLLGIQDGMESVECAAGRQPVCGRDEQGVMWFATSKGVVSVDPAAFVVNPLPPPTHIESLFFERGVTTRKNGEKSTRPIRAAAVIPDSGEPLILPAGSRRVEIRYTATSFSAPEKVRFQTMLEGQDSTWEDAAGRRVAFFHDLGPRDYVFRVRAANNDGVWNESGASLVFTIEPHLWQTWWFQAGVAALLVVTGAGLAGSIARGRLVRAAQRLELREQRNELAHLSRVTMLGELSGSLAHELNQPLTAILSNAQAAQRFMAREPVDMEEVREILADIVEQDKRAGEVIHRLRVLLKRGEVLHQRLDMEEVVRDVLKLVRSDLINHGVTVDTEVAAEAPSVMGDRVQLQQVLLNLVMNGCDAMSGTPAGERRLIVKVGEDGRGKLVVTVTDSGTGIEDEKLDQVFTAFFSTKDHGMGLGLAVCRTIISAHGGRIWAANNPDKGVSFHFTLPAMDGKHHI